MSSRRKRRRTSATSSAIAGSATPAASAVGAAASGSDGASAGPMSVSIGKEMELCGAILKQLLEDPKAKPFIKIKFNRPENNESFIDLIKPSVPMDLSTIKEKFDKGAYATPEDVAVDVRRTFKNVMTYCSIDSDSFTVAEQLATGFEKLFAGVQSRFFKNRIASATQGKSHPVISTPSRTEQRNFIELTMQLSAEHLEQLLTRIREIVPSALTLNESGTTIDVSVDELDVASLRMFTDFCVKCIQANKRQQQQ